MTDRQQYTSHRESLVPNGVEVVVDDPRLENPCGAERAADEGVRLVLSHEVEEASVVLIRCSHYIFTADDVVSGNPDSFLFYQT